MENLTTSKEYLVAGMDCADCAMHVEKKIKQLPGVLETKVNLVNARLQVTFEQSALKDTTIDSALKDIGYSLDQAKVQKSYLQIKELENNDEVEIIDKHLRPIRGIIDLQFNLVSAEIIIVHSIPVSEIIQKLRSIGFTATLRVSANAKDHQKNRTERVLAFTTIFAAFFLLAAIFFEFIAHLPVASLVSISLCIVLGGFPIARKGIKEAKNLQLGMNFLMTLAVLGAAIIGEWFEAGTVVFLFALAQLIEARTMERARRSIGDLIEQRPQLANVLQNGKYVATPVDEVKINQVVVVKPGERLPVDGTILAGSSTVDQSTITGESRPVRVKTGEWVYAGTINKKGFLEIKTEREYGDTTFSKIIKLVAEAQSQKAPQQALVERFSKYYTPGVIIFAVILCIVPPLMWSQPFTTWFYRSLVLLVIACPCALVISTPVTIISGLTNAIRNGILIKGGVFLENFARLKALAFDKTGTLTEGRPQVQKLILMNTHDEEEVLSILASMEAKSEHPLAEAILEYAVNKGAKASDVTDFQVIEGKGIHALLKGIPYFIGNHRLFEEKNFCSESIHKKLEGIEDKNHTAVLAGNESGVFALISISDKVRRAAAGTIQKLKQEGIEEITMLTGDNKRTAAAVAQAVHMDSYHAELLPEDKVRIIKQLKSKFHRVAMIGDGINDAPALAVADIGIAMGAGGSDAALETADIVLMKDNLKKLAYLKLLSNRTLRVIKQNISLALGLKLSFLILAIPGWATLWMAVFADMGASLLVIFNGLRVLKSVRK